MRGGFNGNTKDLSMHGETFNVQKMFWNRTLIMDLMDLDQVEAGTMATEITRTMLSLLLFRWEITVALILR